MVVIRGVLPHGTGKGLPSLFLRFTSMALSSSSCSICVQAWAGVQDTSSSRAQATKSVSHLLTSSCSFFIVFLIPSPPVGVIDLALLICSAFLPIAAFFLDYGLAVTRHAFKQALLVHRRGY